MKKYYCDCCGVELDDSNHAKNNLNSQIKSSVSKEIKLTVEVVCAKNHTWNDGDWCKYCVIDAINELDDRPREERRL